MVQVFFAFISVLCLIHKCTLCDIGYYWRQFTGKIPKDALIGGIDFNKKNLYIGRAYLDGAGIIPTEIKSGEIESDIIWGDVTKTKITEFVEILCGFKDDFKWVPANSTHFQTILLGDEPVVGGYHKGAGLIHIGRIFLNGETKIGKIDSFRREDALFFCIDRERAVQTATNYEVLVYERSFTLLQVD